MTETLGLSNQTVLINSSFPHHISALTLYKYGMGN